VRPGITGWAQVNGRQDIPFSKRFLFDVDYVDRYSFAFDLRIMLMTIFRLNGTGVQSGQIVSDVDDIGLSQIRTHRRNERDA